MIQYYLMKNKMLDFNKNDMEKEIKKSNKTSFAKKT